MRDAALSMRSLMIVNNDSSTLKSKFLPYVQWVLKVQNQRDPNGIDIRTEPKFNIPRSLSLSLSFSLFLSHYYCIKLLFYLCLGSSALCLIFSLSFPPSLPLSLFLSPLSFHKWDSIHRRLVSSPI